MGAVEAIRHVSLEDDFVLAEQSVDKREYYAGEVFTMAGGTHHHDVIITNLIDVDLEAPLQVVCEAVIRKDHPTP